MCDCEGKQVLSESTHTHTLSELHYVLLKQRRALSYLVSTLCSPSMVCSTIVASHIEWTRPNNSQAVKFKYCEKATKIEKNLPSLFEITL